MKNYWILLWGLYISPIAAQPFIDIAGVSTQQGFANPQTSASDFHTHFNQLFLNVPIQKDSDYVLLSPATEYFKIELDESEINLTGTSFTVSWLHQWKNPKWKTAAVVIPRMMSDHENAFGRSSYQLGGAVLMTYFKNEKVKYKWGIYYNNEFFGPFFLPLLGIDWRVNNHLQVFGVLPGNFNLEYKLISNKVYVGLAFKSITNSYRWKEKQFIKISENQLRFFADFYFFKKHRVSVEAGHSFFRKYQQGRRNNGSNDLAEFISHDGILLKASYSFRIRTDH